MHSTPRRQPIVDEAELLSIMAVEWLGDNAAVSSRLSSRVGMPSQRVRDAPASRWGRHSGRVENRIVFIANVT